MSSSSSLPINNLVNTSKYPEINDVILIEKQFLLLTNQYNTINTEYENELKKSEPSRATLKNLLNNLNEVTMQLMKYRKDIDNIKNNKMSRFRTSILNKNVLLNSNLNDITKQLKNEENTLSKIKQRVSDAEGINKEYTRQIKSTNYKYLVLLLIIIFLVVSIIISITVPYKTNLESYLFVILCIVVIYYLYLYIKQYKYDMNHKISTQYGNVKHFLKLG